MDKPRERFIVYLNKGYDHLCRCDNPEGACNALFGCFSGEERTREILDNLELCPTTNDAWATSSWSILHDKANIQKYS